MQDDDVSYEYDMPDAFTTFSSNAGVSAQGEKDSSSAFDSLRPQLHAEYLEHLASNRVMQQQRKAVLECSLQSAIAAATSECPRCGSVEQSAEGRTVTVLWVGLVYRFKLAAPILRCSCCEHSFGVKPLH